MKKFISGFIVGTLLCSMIGVFAVSFVANPLDYKVIVNGEEFTSDPPPVEIEGRTFLPLRAIGDALGVPVNWNEELRQAEVGMVSTEPTVAGYKTYEESSDVIDFGDFCKINQPLEKEYADGYVSYYYDFSDVDVDTYVAYIETMMNNGYTIEEYETDNHLILSCYYGVDEQGGDKKMFSIMNAQKKDDLTIYTIVTIYE